MNDRRKMEKADQTAGARAPNEKAASKLHETFAITAAVSLQDARRLILKHGDTFGVFDNNGDAISAPEARRASIIATPGISPISQ